jgi:hypothetical protein
VATARRGRRSRTAQDTSQIMPGRAEVRPRPGSYEAFERRDVDGLLDPFPTASVPHYRP